eukprot:2671862-Pyramimonas_sp.AAC.1
MKPSGRCGVNSGAVGKRGVNYSNVENNRVTERIAHMQTKTQGSRNGGGVSLVLVEKREAR